MLDVWSIYIAKRMHAKSSTGLVIHQLWPHTHKPSIWIASLSVLAQMVNLTLNSCALWRRKARNLQTGMNKAFDMCAVFYSEHYNQRTRFYSRRYWQDRQFSKLLWGQFFQCLSKYIKHIAVTWIEIVAIEWKKFKNCQMKIDHPYGRFFRCVNNSILEFRH